MQLSKNYVIRNVFKTFTFSSEFIKFCIISKWSIETRFSMLEVLFDIFGACINYWCNLVFICVCCLVTIFLFIVVLPKSVINVLIYDFILDWNGNFFLSVTIYEIFGNQINYQKVWLWKWMSIWKWRKHDLGHSTETVWFYIVFFQTQKHTHTHTHTDKDLYTHIQRVR